MEIMATVSFKTFEPTKVLEMLEAGAHVLRYNLAHGTREEILARLETARLAICQTGDRARLLVDIPGSKSRTLPGEPSRIKVCVNEIRRFFFGPSAPANCIAITAMSEAGRPAVGNLLIVGDGELAFEVQSVNEKWVDAVALVEGAFNLGESIAVQGSTQVFPEAPALSPRDIEIIETVRPEYVAISFVNQADDIMRVREALKGIEGYAPKIVAKIETRPGVDNINAIAVEADALLVARGDLAVFDAYENLFANQSRCIAVARNQMKECWVGTQLLDSAVLNYIPSRSNICDVAYLALSGIHGLMLSRETGLASHPGRVISTTRRIIDATMKSGG